MRILLLPNIGLGNINADSDYYDYSKLIDVANRYYDDMFFYLVLSERHANQIPNLPRTKIIPIAETSDYGINEHMTTFEFVKQFHLRGGNIITDGMFTSRFHVGLWWRSGPLDFKRAYNYPVIYRQSVLYEKQQNFTDYDATYALANVVCNTIVDGQQAYDHTLGLVERFLSPAMVKEFVDQTLISTVGLDLPYFDLLIKKNRKHEKFTLFYGTRFNTTKRVELIFQLYDKFYSSGREIDIIMTTPTAQSALQKKKFMKEYLTRSIKFFYPDCGRYKYFEEASKCHAFVVASEGENVSNFIVEQMYLGLIAVLPDKPYVWTMLPKDYPFIYRSFEEAYSWLAWISEDYDRALKRMEPYRQYIRDNYLVDETFRRNLNFLRETVTRQLGYDCEAFPIKQLYTLIKEVSLEFDKPFTLDTFMAILNKRMVLKIGYSSPDKVGQRQLTPLDVRIALHRIGFRDTCETEVPTFKKIEDEFYVEEKRR